MFNGKGIGRRVKIDLGGGFDANGIVDKIELVEVQGDDLVFGVSLLKFCGDDPFIQFLKNPLGF